MEKQADVYTLTGLYQLKNMMILSSTNSWGMMQEILEEEVMRTKERILAREQSKSCGEEVIREKEAPLEILSE
tara:strand:+ start:2559 stop:2777 length:219 start_codon:yes stop_codon:yes gene_type:complete